jgi:uncharacterized protein (TIGR02996 family)
VTTERDLFDAIGAVPDDDGPRLVFADWVEEHGDPERAEFIRLQIRLAGLDEYDPDFKRLSDRESELFRGNFFRWKIPDLKGVQEFHRGFVDSVWIRGDQLKHYEKTIGQNGTVTRLRVSGIDRRMKELATIPWLSRLRELDLTNNTIVRFLLPELFEESDWSHLQSLVLRNIRLWPEDIEPLLDHPGFPNLRRLDVSGNPLGDEGLRVIAQSARLSPLRELAFKSDGLDESETVHAAGMTSLGESTTLTALQSLDLSGHNPAGRGLIALASRPLVRPVRKLALALKGYAKKDEPEWATEFLGSAQFLSLRVLVLGGKFSHPSDSMNFANWHKRNPHVILDLRKMLLEPEDRIILESGSERMLLPPAEEVS